MAQPKKQNPLLEDPLQLLPRGLTKMFSLYLGHFYPFAEFGRKVSLHYTSKVCRPHASRISLGNLVSLGAYVTLNVSAQDPIGETAIVLEDNCHICFGSIISARNRIHLERDVLVGQVVVIADHNHAYEDVTVPVLNQGITEGGTIRIGQGTWIGHGASIICSRGELTIGRNCVIAANSMVMRSVPDYSVVFGNPAKVIRQFDPVEGAWVIGSIPGASATSQPSHVNL
jgi:acetyltransferase-like isoleucine patch superfamily enzyme